MALAKISAEKSMLVVARSIVSVLITAPAEQSHAAMPPRV